uniref:Phospholipid-binding lipoprotein MlaA n=1 Tax=Candidatus Kentrum sp. LFY TaxID=2126342 RepID=A0A450UDK0_9GAMM|nr:MAG: phospholipid-binding lipoprotein MlaA [Candidatus Kentron sp. LFY]VFJ90562.1 MAG: phospholipid-binding lipoprotein MlaA [Candidatus Kentron sp. LFY]
MNRKKRFGIEIVLFLFLYMLASGCSGASAQEEGDGDPLKGMNEIFYGINDVLDKAFLEPVAEIYADHLPAGFQSGISNFFDNLAYPGVIINNILQGKIGNGIKSTGRFIINTIFGIGGLFDPATSLGLERQKEDFGQTLGVWGAGEGAYLVLPAIGPSSVRDTPGVVADIFTNLLYYAESSVMVPLIAVRAVERRADFLEVTRVRDKSLDPYLFTREAYRQRRMDLIYDGEPPYQYDVYEDDEESQ